MLVTETVRVALRPRDCSGYLRETDLTLDTFSGLDWPPDVVERERRVVIDLGNITGFGGSVVERIARILVDAGVGIVQVEGSRKANVRATFLQRLREATAEYAQALR
jgi:hypothetical protein